ncbi:hypothetical protein RvY_02951 [Ramazzottius varieornatus]|uniref:Uncharacterized protein n=1 Tax=Ramazzottius varieornatus TaxID=947166 RepID=A0A1D1ULD8_RAMVA|nr:hypothetical protein RvY_02951 [Ramazzottius varieornatus]
MSLRLHGMLTSNRPVTRIRFLAGSMDSSISSSSHRTSSNSLHLPSLQHKTATVSTRFHKPANSLSEQGSEEGNSTKKRRKNIFYSFPKIWFFIWDTLWPAKQIVMTSLQSNWMYIDCALVDCRSPGSLWFLKFLTILIFHFSCLFLPICLPDFITNIGIQTLKDRLQ